jgi:hypothetical protein
MNITFEIEVFIKNDVQARQNRNSVLERRALTEP